MTDHATGERVQWGMDRKHWSKTRLAKEVGSDQPTISRIVSGELRGRELLPKIAERLEVPLEWLTVGDNPPKWAISEEKRPSAENDAQEPKTETEAATEARIAALNYVVNQQALRIAEMEVELAQIHQQIMHDVSRIRTKRGYGQTIGDDKT